MPNKKKKAPRNAFSFYLDDAMDELRREGHKIHKKSDAVPLVFDKWKNLPDEQKKTYQSMADKWKSEKKCAPRMGRLDCTGMPVDHRVNFDVEIALKRQEQRCMIRANWATRYGISKESFYFISFQSYFEFPNEEGYQPCEIACVKFSLRHGIENEWHAFIDPGPLRPGLGAEAKIFTEKTHQIPIYGFEHARQDHYQLWCELIQFVEKVEKSGEKTIPPLYCKGSEMHKTNFCLNYISDLARVSNRLVKVHYLEDLVTELYEKVNEKSAPSSAIIEDALGSSILDYENNTKCDYHHEIERIHCALLTVKKSCFWMSDAFHEHYGYELTDKHIPVSDVQYGMVQPGEEAWKDHEAIRHISSSIKNKNIAYQKSSTTGEMVETRMANTDIRYRNKELINPDGFDAVGIEGNDNDADGEDSENENKFPLRRPKAEILKIIEAKQEAVKKRMENISLAARFPTTSQHATNGTMDG